jgi:hypothetical protein
MRAVMLGYWVILVGVILDVVEPVTGETAAGGLLTPEWLKFIGIVVVVLGLLLGFRLGLKRRS